MVVWQRITFIGTSHISTQSLQDVAHALEEHKPEVVALELDKQRLHGLLSETKEKPSLRLMTKIGWKGYLFAKLGEYAERKMGNLVGMSPGAEMKHAYTLAQEKGIRVALIDQPIAITLKKISQTLTWKEKWHFFVDVIKGMFGKQPQLTFDLRRVPSHEIIEKLLEHVSRRYPSLYNVLVLERNAYMAQRLYRLNEQYTVVAVIGAGHVQGVVTELEQCLTKKV